MPERMGQVDLLGNELNLWAFQDPNVGADLRLVDAHEDAIDRLFEESPPGKVARAHLHMPEVLRSDLE